MQNAVGKLAVKILVYKHLHTRKHAGFFLASIKQVTSSHRKEAFWKSFPHYVAPQSLRFFLRGSLPPPAIHVNKRGQCVLLLRSFLWEKMYIKILLPEKGNTAQTSGYTAFLVVHLCGLGGDSAEYTANHSQFEMNAKVCSRTALSISGGRPVKCNLACHNGHYTKVVDLLPMDIRGHPIVCYIDDLLDDVHQKSVHLLHTGNHFNVVGSVRKSYMSTFTIHRPSETVGEEGGGCIDWRRLPHFTLNPRRACTARVTVLGL